MVAKIVISRPWAPERRISAQVPFCVAALNVGVQAAAPPHIWVFSFQKLKRNGELPNGRYIPMDERKTSLQGFDPCGFGNRLRSARKVFGITQEELAEKLCVDRNHIARMERGARVCSIDLLVELAEVLNVSTDYLLVGISSSDAAKEKLLSTIKQLTQIAQSL